LNIASSMSNGTPYSKNCGWMLPKHKGTNLTSSGLSAGLSFRHKPRKLSFSARKSLFSTIAPYPSVLIQVFPINLRAYRNKDSLFWLAYATAANTSINRSRTTGDVLDDVKTSSRVSKNLRDIICCINISDEFRSIIAQSCE
jgi:hypothetical protein